MFPIFSIRLISRETNTIVLGRERPALCGREPCLFERHLTQRATNWTRASAWLASRSWRAQAAKCLRMSYRSCSNLYKKTIFRKMNSSWGQSCPGWVSSCSSSCVWSCLFCLRICLMFENCTLCNACSSLRNLKSNLVGIEDTRTVLFNVLWCTQLWTKNGQGWPEQQGRAWELVSSSLFLVDAFQAEIVSVNIQNIKVVHCALKPVRWIDLSWLKGEIPFSLPLIPGAENMRDWERIVSQLWFFSFQSSRCTPLLTFAHL